jgi:enoyl-CoA hydratase/carnithine racemase
MLLYKQNVTNSMRYWIVLRSKSLCTSTEVILEKINRVGCITLNRPKQMNTLTIDTFKSIHPKIIEWENDQNILMILIRGVGNAFCAGADVKSIRNFAVGDDKNAPLNFFKAGYKLIYEYSKCQKTFLALINGVTLGGGISN